MKKLSLILFSLLLMIMTVSCGEDDSDLKENGVTVRSCDKCQSGCCEICWSCQGGSQSSRGDNIYKCLECPPESE